jgi:Bifunctional DNA primase/polymerase, N-terminal
VSPLGEAALALAAAGHPVLPLHTPRGDRGCSCGRYRCHAAGKHPRGVYGLTHATTNPVRIEEWWFGHPEANVGMRTDSLLAFDLDCGGRRSLTELEWELGELPETRAQFSGRGSHRFYRLPAKVSIGNTTAPLGDPPGLHLRAGTRGYVVVAPSLHASGRRYRWVDPEQPIADLPTSWLKRLLELPELPAAEPLPRGDSTRYGLVALEAELAVLARTPQGSRNNALNKAVFRLAQLVAGGELEHDYLYERAHAAALAVGLGEYETAKTIASATKAGLRSPRRR